MDKRIDRRQALALFGAVGVGAVMAACSGDDGGDNAAGDTGETTSSSAAGSTSTTATAIAAAGSGAVTAAMFDAAGACALTPEQTEGPYYLDIDSLRSDIREDRQGVPLRVAVRVRHARSCTPVADAAVDIWHCDAEGIYSGFEDASRRGGVGTNRTDSSRFLRGTQVTDADGIAEFLTVYPGWYRGRTVHIHCKVHVDNAEALTTQFYFDEKVTREVSRAQPYAADTDQDTTNGDDRIFNDELVLTISKDGDGYLGLINLDVA